MVKKNIPLQNTEPVTLVFRFKVKKDKEKEFEQWAHAITQAALHFEGYLGSNWIHHGPNSREYLVIYKFSNFQLFQKWAHSSIREKYLKKVNPLIEQQRPERLKKITGLETWFTLPDEVMIKPPPRWKMVIATMIGIYPVALIYQVFLIKYIGKVPLLFRPIALSLILTPILTYVIMPNLTKLFHKWLYPEK
jgi:antibiotic biosynthesis monooxygenase (ABM) superfamily enzyme